MASANLSFYANERDTEELLQWLIDQKEIAFILPDGERRWKAFDRVALPQVVGRKICLWHVPSGPLPLLQPGEQADLLVENPWEGWTELRTGADPSSPYFGPRPDTVFRMRLAPTSQRISVPDPGLQFKMASPLGTRVIGRSDFEYPGKSQRRSKAALAFWNRLAGHLSAIGICVDALGWLSPDKNPTPDRVKDNDDYIALPGALAEMRHGTPWNPYPG